MPRCVWVENVWDWWKNCTQIAERPEKWCDLLSEKEYKGLTVEQGCCAYGGGDKFGTPTPTVTPSLKPSPCVDEPEFVWFQSDARNYTCKDISESFCHDYANAWSEQLSKNTKLVCFTCDGSRHTAAVGSNTPSISPTWSRLEDWWSWFHMV